MTLLREFGGFAGRSVSRKSITRCSDEACVNLSVTFHRKNCIVCNRRGFHFEIQCLLPRLCEMGPAGGNNG